jgi:ABC-type transporter Mla subunit MlaD
MTEAQYDADEIDQVKQLIAETLSADLKAAAGEAEGSRIEAGTCSTLEELGELGDRIVNETADKLKAKLEEHEQKLKEFSDKLGQATTSYRDTEDQNAQSQETVNQNLQAL